VPALTTRPFAPGKICFNCLIGYLLVDSYNIVKIKYKHTYNKNILKQLIRKRSIFKILNFILTANNTLNTDRAR
jgi:hypothetical protein